MTESDNIEIRSDEVQEIMGTPPKWIIRRGITVILLVVIILLVGSYFYKYPDLIQARVTILSENPPISIIARSEGKLEMLFVADKQKVKANSLLGVIENPANYEDVYALIQNLDTIKGYFSSSGLLNSLHFEKEYSIGQYHSFYSSFVSLLNDYQTFLSFNPYEQRVESLQKQVADYQYFYEKSQEQIAILKQDYKLAFSQFLRDSLLHVKKVMPDVNFEMAKAGMLKQKFTYQNALTGLASTRITMNQLDQQILEQKMSKVEMGRKLLTALKERYDNLTNQLK